MWNGAVGDDDPVPTMGDFNRERRFFTVSEVIAFADKSLDLYYNLTKNAGDEFEDYELPNDAEFFAIDMDGDKQEAGSTTMIKNEEDGTWPGPLGRKPAEFKKWLRDIREFQISYSNITIRYPQSSGHDGCYAWDVT